MLTRRSFLMAVSAGATALLAGCSQNTQESADNETSTITEAQAPSAAEGAGAVLVAYFSATGNTEGIAQAIANSLEADQFAMEPAEPYTNEDLNYNNDASRVSQERESDARPELSQVTPDNWDTYTTVFIGYPIWWGGSAFPVRTFVENNSFEGKTVIPFCTSGSSGIGSSAEMLADLAGTGDWQDGERFAAGATSEAMSWADSIA